jgi:superfamily II DNA/RNA helicase
VPEELNQVLEFEQVFEYNIRTAIEDGVCVDYELYLPYLETVEPAVSTGVVLKAQFLATGMLRTGKRRCIVYLNTIADCREFASTVKELFEEYHGISIETFTINCETSKANRKEILEQFSESNYDTIKIIMNVRILNEAIDIVACDSVYVTQIGEQTNDITIVQRLGRTLRKDPANPFKTAAMFVWCDEWNQCVNGLQLLKQEDVEFHNKIHVASGNYDNTETCRPKVEEQREEVLKFVRVQCLTLAELWDIRRLSWKQQFQTLGKNPSQQSANADEKRAARWQMRVRTDYKKQKLSDERIESLNQTEGWTWSEVVFSFEDSLLNWTKLFQTLGKSPSDSSANADEKRAAIWQMTVRSSYKKRKLSDERIEFLNQTEGWTWSEVVFSFEDSLLNWTKLFQTLGKNPSQQSANADEKRAAIWQMRVRSSYKKRKLSDERIEFLNQTEGWTWGSSFEDSLLHWTKLFQTLGKYPYERSANADEKRAATWQQTVRTAYKKQKLSDERIECLNQTEGWTWGGEGSSFEDSLINWTKQFQTLGKNPSAVSANADEKRAARWQSSVRQAYKKRKLSDERIEFLNQTEGWTWAGEGSSFED